jgi:hypothetical protein
MGSSRRNRARRQALSKRKLFSLKSPEIGARVRVTQSLLEIDFPFVSAYIFRIRVLIGGNLSQLLNFNPKEES